MRALVLVGLTLLLSACQTFQGNQASPYFVVPKGSTLTLNRDLSIPPDRPGVYLQLGKQSDTLGPINQYTPYCRFELRSLSDTPRTVRPEKFMITRVHQETPLAGVPSGFRLARVSSEATGEPAYYIFATLLDLHSDTQPDVYRLDCRHYQYPFVTARHLSVDEIRQALGDTLTLSLPGNR